jgi:hypothetical protein
MRRLIGLIGLAAVAGASLAATSVLAAASSLPSAGGVVIHPIAPSNLAPSGAFVEKIVEANPSPGNCGFFLYRGVSSQSQGGLAYTSLGFHKGTQATDVAPQPAGYLQYKLFPTDCAGHVGAPVYSTEVIPVVSDDSLLWVASGAATTVYSTKYYGGSAVQTKGTGADVRLSLDTYWNFGLVVGTGPRGGVGTVFVNGVKTGTINFYSAKVGGEKVSFVALGINPFVETVIDIVATAPGHGGGSSMYFDAGIGNYFID